MLKERTERPRSKRLEAVLLLLALAPLFALNSPSDLDQSVRLRGAALWVACLIPAVTYVFRKPAAREPVPFFPLFGVVFGIYFAIPAVAGTVNLAFNPNQFLITWLDPGRAFDTAIDLALNGWLALLAGYFAARVIARTRRVTEPPFPTRGVGPMLMWIAGIGILLDIVASSVALPAVVTGLVGFAGTLSRFAIAALLVLRTQRQLSKREASFVVFAIPVELVVLLSTGSIAKVFLFGFLLLTGYWMVGGRIPISWIVAGLTSAALLITLKGVLQDYRRRAWFSGANLSVVERVQLMAELVGGQVGERGPTGALAIGAKSATGRSAILDIFADVTERTPRDVPYWGGVTYLSLVGVAIPRVLWPGKPEKRLGQDFGHRYNYIDSRDLSTSVNLPFLVEFYMNFGVIGVYVGMLLTGVFLRLVDSVLNRPGQSTIQSLASAAILLPLLNVESDFSLIFGGVFLNAVSMAIVLRYLRKRALERGDVGPGSRPRAMSFPAARAR